ncbi:hypothetical protein M2478_001844 [Breznakia sp. PFB2-8]|nr:hypothetical protein [Breznakia sp. PFB2-8]MDF9860577.1 hypothetical protein [Breznakia sp. PH5-24]
MRKGGEEELSKIIKLNDIYLDCVKKDKTNI